MALFIFFIAEVYLAAMTAYVNINRAFYALLDNLVLDSRHRTRASFTMYLLLVVFTDIDNLGLLHIVQETHLNAALSIVFFKRLWPLDWCTLSIPFAFL